jgi:hypothetical protein
MCRRHPFQLDLLRIKLIEILLTELKKGQFGYQNPKRFSIVENSICLFMLFSDIELKFNYRDYNVIKNEG